MDLRPQFPRGGRLEYLHPGPVSHKRRQKGIQSQMIQYDIVSSFAGLGPESDGTGGVCTSKLPILSS
jgi:hypothetical protein